MPDFFGANLIAPQKSDGGIRLITIRNTFRRLVAKLSCRLIRERIGTYLYPRQLGFGRAKGREIIIPTVRNFLTLNAATTNVLLKMDFKNSFNRIERDCILKVIKKHFQSFMNLYGKLADIHPIFINLWF